MQQVPVEDGLDQIGDADHLWMLAVELTGGCPAVWKRSRVSLINLWEQHNDVTGSSMLHKAQLSDEGVIEPHNGLNASVEVHVEVARLIVTGLGNVKEALIRQVRSFSVEW